MSNFIVRPSCCARVQQENEVSVFLSVGSDYFYGDGIAHPRWVISGERVDGPVVEFGRGASTSLIVVTHCPFCGAHLPPVETVVPPGPVCKVVDGGYYCATCGDRLIGCKCLPPAAMFRAKPVEGVKRQPHGGVHWRRVCLLGADEEGIKFRSLISSAGDPIVPDEMRERAMEIADHFRKNIESVDAGEVRTIFRVTPPFDEDEGEEAWDSFN